MLWWPSSVLGWLQRAALTNRKAVVEWHNDVLGATEGGSLERRGNHVRNIEARAKASTSGTKDVMEMWCA